jgi:hypothetical protein
VAQQLADQLGLLDGIAAAPGAALDLDIWPRALMIEQLIEVDGEILALVEDPPAPAALLNRGDPIRLEVLAVEAYCPIGGRFVARVRSLF